VVYKKLCGDQIQIIYPINVGEIEQKDAQSQDPADKLGNYDSSCHSEFRCIGTENLIDSSVAEFTPPKAGLSQNAKMSYPTSFLICHSDPAFVGGRISVFIHPHPTFSPR